MRPLTHPLLAVLGRDTPWRVTHSGTGLEVTASRIVKLPRDGRRPARLAGAPAPSLESTAAGVSQYEAGGWVARQARCGDRQSGRCGCSHRCAPSRFAARPLASRSRKTDAETRREPRLRVTFRILQWARKVSNLRPSRCQRDALPLSYAPELPARRVYSAPSGGVNGVGSRPPGRGRAPARPDRPARPRARLRRTRPPPASRGRATRAGAPGAARPRTRRGRR